MFITVFKHFCFAFCQYIHVQPQWRHLKHYDLSIVFDDSIKPPLTIAGYSRLGTDLLFMKETRDYIKKLMMKKKIIGVWDVYKGTQLFMYSADHEELQQAIDILHECLKEFTVNIEPQAATALLREGDHSILAKLQQEHAGQIKVAVRDQRIQVATVDTFEAVVKCEIDKFRDLHQRVTEFCRVDSSKYRYLMQFKKKEISEIKNQVSRQNVKVTENNNGCGFEVSGKKDFCIEAISKLRQIVDNVSQATENYNWPGFGEYLKSEEGKETLISLELTNKCVLQYQIGSQRRDESKDGRHGKPGPPKSEDYKLGGCMVSYVVGDILAVEADFLVNPTDTHLSNTTRIGSEIVEKGNY